jgi:hypothetical protein
VFRDESERPFLQKKTQPSQDVTSSRSGRKEEGKYLGICICNKAMWLKRKDGAEEATSKRWI